MRVDVLYDSLATETRWFNDPKEAEGYARIQDSDANVLEVQIDGVKIKLDKREK